MTEKKAIHGVPDPKGRTTFDNQTEKKGQNSAQVSENKPPGGFNPPPQSMDAQTSKADSDG